MTDYDFDLFVVGAGSGGVRASRMAAAHGAKVAVAEDRYLGGTCVNVGCVPKKLFVYASHYCEDFADSAAYGWSAPPAQFDWPALRDNKNVEITRLNGVYQGLLDDAGVEVLNGTAHIEDAHTVSVNGRRIRAERLLVATGSWPLVGEVHGREHIITSNEAFHLQSLPRRAVIVGGGYIAVEFAGIFAGLGVEVTQLYRGPLFLRGFDDDIRRFVAAEIRKKDIDLRFDSNVARVERRPDGALRVMLVDGSHLDTDLVMCAIGRRPHVAGLGLENAGVQTDERGAVTVDARFRTTADNIHAIGDVIDRYQLTPVAIAEAMSVTGDLYGDDHRPMDYEYIPTAVFCQPNIGTVGLTEAAARERYAEVQIFRSEFRPMKHTLTGRDERTMMKLVVDAASDRVVGVHMVGADAGETIQGMGVALKAGATKATFDATIGIHPTAAEEFVTMREPVA